MVRNFLFSLKHVGKNFFMFTTSHLSNNNVYNTNCIVPSAQQNVHTFNGSNICTTNLCLSWKVSERRSRRTTVEYLGHVKEIGTNRKYRPIMVITQWLTSLMGEDHFVYMRSAFFMRIKCLWLSQNACTFKFHYTGEGTRWRGSDPTVTYIIGLVHHNSSSPMRCMWW